MHILPSLLRRVLATALLFFLLLHARANNIQVSGVTVTGGNISFTLSWENSWNTMSNINPLYPNNWDGVWIFVKYQNNIDNLWKHATLSSNGGDHSVSGAGGVLQVDAVTDGMGVFIRRTNPGSGNISSAAVTLKMNALTGTGSFNFKVFGIEMVYVPQSDFQLGDGNSSGTAYFTAQTIDATKQSGGLAAGALYTASPAVPATFPMGYNAFYAMKYEISSEQWVDFMNTLTYDQQATRMPYNVPNSAAGSTPYYNPGVPHSNTCFAVKIAASGLNNTTPAVFGCDFSGNGVYNEANDGQNIAMTGISKGDLMAYLDWSGLRPMTEMEFEKACRGTRPAVTGEYPWGSTAQAIYVRSNLTNSGTSSEAATGAVVNGRSMLTTWTNNGQGAARTGVFATASTGRESSGAGFYGNMEMGGNAWDMAIAVDATGVGFTGAHGDGALTTSGDPNAAGWPSGALSTGFMRKGNSWYEGANSASLSTWTQTSYRIGDPTAGRSIAYGGRGVRTAP